MRRLVRGLRRGLVIPAVVTSAALIASSCGGWRQDDAARVDGEDIPAARLQDDTRALLDQPAVSDVLLGPGLVAADPLGGGAAGAPEGRLPTAALSTLLDQRIIEVLAGRELAARGIELTDADLSGAEQAIRGRLTAAQLEGTTAPAAGQPADPVAGFDALPGAVRGRLVRTEAVVARLRVELAGGELDDFPADAEAWYRDNPEQFEEFCLSVAPVADEAEGRRLAAESASGQLPLADLVTRQRGQQAGCGLGFQLREQLLPDLATALERAPVGRAVGPFPGTDGRQILVGVSSRTPQPFADVEADAARLYQAERTGLEAGPWQEWLADQRPDVTIDPRYGSWDAEANTVRPPQGTRAAAGGLAP